jgi:hypothetical protein
MNALHAFNNSDWAGCKSSQKSIGGFLQFYGPDEMIQSQHSTAPISWSSKQPTMVALSTLEAEFIACSNATREVVWLRALMESIICERPPQTPVYMDNHGALKLAETSVLQARMKLIDVKFMHCHDEQVKRILRFIYVPTKDNVANLMTKPLLTERHIRLMELLDCGMGVGG